MKKLILASNSPRRSELLKNYGFNFEIVASDYEETQLNSDPVLTAKTFAKGKAQSVFDKLSDKSFVVLGADTVVYYDGKILGKPSSREQAYDMLKLLSGKTHQVITGYCLVDCERCLLKSEKSLVTFNELTAEQIYKYLDSGLYNGKAGSYGIQDGFNLVKSCKGSVNNVIGLPVEIIAPEIDEWLKK